MPWTVDARVPVRLGAWADAQAGDAVLAEADGPAPDGVPVARFDAAGEHAAGCACCVPRTAAALALDRLFQARARGEVPFFRRVLAVTATPEGDLAVWSALRLDPLTSGRYRPDPDP